MAPPVGGHKALNVSYISFYRDTAIYAKGLLLHEDKMIPAGQHRILGGHGPRVFGNSA